MALTNSTPALDTPPKLTGGFVGGRFDGASLGDKRYMNINMYHNALTKQKKNYVTVVKNNAQIITKILCTMFYTLTGFCWRARLTRDVPS